LAPAIEGSFDQKIACQLTKIGRSPSLQRFFVCGEAMMAVSEERLFSGFAVLYGCCGARAVKGPT